MIKAIIFDLGGVLFTNGTKKFIKSLSSRYKIPRDKVKEIMDGKLGSEYREGKITRDEFWKKLLSQLHIDEEINTLEDEWINGYELIEGTRDIILELSKNYKVYYLSDNVRERVERINGKYSFFQWFEGGIFSHEVGVKKPHPQIYRLALEKASVHPNEAVFIDDKESCLPPAIEMGMTTILFTSPEQLRKELIQLNLVHKFGKFSRKEFCYKITNFN